MPSRSASSQWERSPVARASRMREPAALVKSARHDAPTP